VTGDHGVGEGMSEADEGAPVDGVLEAAEGWLGGDGGAVDRVAPEKGAGDRIVDQMRRVVAVLVAGDEQEDSLAQEVCEGVLHAARIARISHHRGERGAQPEPLVGGLQ